MARVFLAINSNTEITQYRKFFFMENEILETVTEYMLSEGIDKDTITAVLKSLISEGYNLSRLTMKRGGSPRFMNKAIRIPSDNDYHQKDDGDLDFSRMTGKTVTKRLSGDYHTNERDPRSKNRHVARGTDEFPSANTVEKSIARHRKKISESCYNEIMNLIESIINELYPASPENKLKALKRREPNNAKSTKEFFDSKKKRDDYFNNVVRKVRDEKEAFLKANPPRSDEKKNSAKRRESYFKDHDYTGKARDPKNLIKAEKEIRNLDKKLQDANAKYDKIVSNAGEKDDKKRHDRAKLNRVKRLIDSSYDVRNAAELKRTQQN